MILTNDQIIDAYRKQNILINPFDEKQIQGATYDLRVGDKGATTSSKKLVHIRETGYLRLEPGDFGIIIVFEELRIGPQYAARFGLRSKYARKGLIATTGPQIDPGYHGRLILGLTNLTPKPITLAYKDDLVSIEFHQLDQPSTKPYDGPYQDKMDLGPEEIEFITETEGMALSEVLTTLRSLSQNVAMLSSEVRTLRWAIPVITALGFAITAVIVAIK